MFRVIEANTEVLRRDALDLRHQVFVLGQGIATKVEIDGLDGDPSMRHFLLLKKGPAGEMPIGACRVLNPYEGDPAIAKIQRVCVLPRQRMEGAGTALMQGVHDLFEAVKIFKLSSQVAAVRLYERLGYVFDGPAYREEETGIPHRDMVLRRSPAP